MRRFWFPIILGLTAAALTAALMVLSARNPYVTHLPVVSDVLAFGVMIALIPFGGIHEMRLPDPVAIPLGATFNGALWFALSASVISIYRGIRRIRQSTIDDHVT